MALLISLVFLLLLTLIGVSSMQNATLQERMAASMGFHNQSFQAAEAALRVGERAVQQGIFTLAACASSVRCAPPAESSVVAAAGFNTSSGVSWIATGDGFYGVQNIGTTRSAVNLPSNTRATLYRVTAIGLSGRSRSVLESIYAKPPVTLACARQCAMFLGGGIIGASSSFARGKLVEREAFSGKMRNYAVLDSNGDGVAESTDQLSSGGSRRIMWRQIQ